MREKTSEGEAIRQQLWWCVGPSRWCVRLRWGTIKQDRNGKLLEWRRTRMRAIWQVESGDVIQLQGREREFAEFVNALLQQQAHAGRLPLVALALNLKIHAPDRGVDARVTQPIAAGLDPSGYL